jgi:GxxExxY protein
VITKKYLDELTYEIIGASIEVQKIMGRGLLEGVYHQCLKEELNNRKINFQTEMKVPVFYKEKKLDIDFRCDFFIEKCIVVELKSVQELTNAFEAQLLTYMKLLKSPKGILINFNCSNIFYEGQKTLVNEYFTLLPQSN